MRSRNPSDDGDHRQFDVLEERGLECPAQLSRTQSGQKKRFSETQSLASPKSGMTGSP